MDATELSKAIKCLSSEREQMTSFFLCHALCHTVEPVTRTKWCQAKLLLVIKSGKLK